MDKKNLRRADLITSIILAAIGLWITVYCLNMMFSLLAQGMGSWYSSPALLPLLCSISLIICAVSLFTTAVKDGARFDFITKDSVKAFVKTPVFLGCAGIIAWIAVYIYVLLQLLPYWFATFIFLFAFMALFKGTSTKDMIKSTVIAAATTAIIAYGFGTLAMIPLP